MQSTSWSSALTALSAEQRQQVLDSPQLDTLPAIFATILDPRSRHGRRYPLPFLLTRLVTAMLCHCNSLEAVGQWCREHRALLRRRFPDQRHLTPTGSLFRRLLPRLSAEQLEWRIAGWLQQQDTVAEDEALALDGKTVRGSGAAGGPPIHLLSVSTHDSGQTLCQVEVGEKTNEIPVARHWIRDGVFGEDGSCLRTGTAPQLMATIRNLVISLIRGQGTRKITATRRHYAAHPGQALRLILGSPSTPR